MTEKWWDEEFDVVILGGGGAGLMAALEAAEAGGSVLLAEQQPGLGGATGMAVGSITAAGTALQRAVGIEDDVDAHYRDLQTMMEPARARGEAYDEELSRLMVDLAPGVVERLSGLGVTFSGPHPEHPHLTYRMHNVVPDTTAYIDTLAEAATARGVVIRTGTTIYELQREGDGPVSIVSLGPARGSQRRAVRARKAVILAAGDFSANDELARAHGRPPEISAFDPIRTYATGEGVRLATAIGAATVAMERTGFPNFRTVTPPYCSPEVELFRAGAILVNREGKRYTNELGRAVFDTNQQPGKTAHLIFDAKVAARVATAAEDTGPSRDGWHRNGKTFLCTFPAVAYAYIDDLLTQTDYLVTAPTLRALAEKAQLPADALEREAAAYNALVRDGGADPFGRTELGGGVSEPPYYAFGPIKPFLIFSGGGLAVDRDMHVLDASGAPIPHLYACGANAEAGVFLGGHGHHLAWAFGTGRVAGQNAMREDAR